PRANLKVESVHRHDIVVAFVKGANVEREGGVRRHARSLAGQGDGAKGRAPAGIPSIGGDTRAEEPVFRHPRIGDKLCERHASRRSTRILRPCRCPTPFTPATATALARSTPSFSSAA